MTTIRPLQPEHYEELYPIQCRAANVYGMTLQQFSDGMGQRSGFTVFHNDKIIGCVSFSDYIPDHDIMMHTFIDHDYRGKWINRQMIRDVFLHYCFGQLNCRRVTTCVIEGQTDNAHKMLQKLGFVLEGTIRKRVKIEADFFNLEIYGALKEEFRGRI